MPFLLLMYNHRQIKLHSLQKTTQSSAIVIITAFMKLKCSELPGRSSMLACLWHVRHFQTLHEPEQNYIHTTLTPTSTIRAVPGHSSCSHSPLCIGTSNRDACHKLCFYLIQMRRNKRESVELMIHDIA